MMNPRPKTSVILLAGGLGTRMQSSTPKQFLPLGNKPVARHSYDIFSSLAEIDEVVVVCAPEFRHFFLDNPTAKPLAFAAPGKRRQDSVYNGLLATSPSHHLICIHDAARPLIDCKLVLRVLEAASAVGAATAGMPLNFTIKESTPDNIVKSTPDRSKFWEIQTPQAAHRHLLLEGFRFAHAHHITVTDDVSLVELLHKEVKLVDGSYHNLKITTPSDLVIASYFIDSTSNGAGFA